MVLLQRKGPGEMAWWGKYLLLKHEVLTDDPAKQLHKNQVQ